MTRFIQNFPELAFDVPHLAKITFDGIIKPLSVENKVMNLKFINWIPPTPAEGEDDDLDFSDSQFKLAALILDHHLTNEKNPNPA